MAFKSSDTSLTWNDLNQTRFLLYNAVFLLATDLILYPADLLATRLQADHVSSGSVRVGRLLAEIFKREGFRALLEARAEWLSTILDFSNTNRIFWVELLCNAVAGILAEACSAISYVPADMITQRLQVSSRKSFYRSDANQSLRSITRHLYMTEGLSGFFRGYVPYLLVHGPGSAVWWSSYEATKMMLFKLYHRLNYEKTINEEGIILKTATFGLSGSIAGSTSYIVTNPLEVAKTRLQLMELGHKRDKMALTRGFWYILADLFRKEGINGMFKGLKPRLLLHVPVASITIMAYEYLKEFSANV